MPGVRRRNWMHLQLTTKLRELFFCFVVFPFDENSATRDASICIFIIRGDPYVMWVLPPADCNPAQVRVHLRLLTTLPPPFSLFFIWHFIATQVPYTYAKSLKSKFLQIFTFCQVHISNCIRAIIVNYFTRRLIILQVDFKCYIDTGRFTFYSINKKYCIF